MVVHLFGHPVDMDPVMKVARKYNLRVIEDCAEAHGATYKGKTVGEFGDIGCFSFYANKIITTGEGGMVTTNDAAIADKARSLKSLAFGTRERFMHTDIGYNYRMTNIQAAMGCAQLEKIDSIIEKKRSMANFYTAQFKNVPSLQLPVEKSYARNVYWMYHVALKDKFFGKRSEVMEHLKQCGIETREGFIPYNMQDFALSRGLVKIEECPRANSFARCCFYLPSSPSLSLEDLEYVAESLKDILKM
jgi:perosamine synthetase